MADPLSTIAAKAAGEAAKGLGIGNLTSPTFEFLGFKIRDTIRGWMSAKSKERAALRRAEKAFLYRQLDLQAYGNDQYASCLEGIGAVMMDRHFSLITPLMRQIVNNHQIPPERTMEIFMHGFTELDKDMEAHAHNRERPKLEGGELILYTLGAGLLDVALSVQSAKMLFHFTYMPAALHSNRPDVPDDVLDQMMQDHGLLKDISDQMETDTFDFTKRFVRLLHDAYGLPFDELEYESKEKGLSQQTGKD